MKPGKRAEGGSTIVAIGWHDVRVLAGLLTLGLSGCASLESSDGGAGNDTRAQPGGGETTRISVGAAVPDPSEARPRKADTAAQASEVTFDTPLVPELLTAEVPEPDLWARLRGRFDLEAPRAEYIEAELGRYSGRQEYFDVVLERGEPYVRYILERIEARGMPAELVLVPLVESTFRPFAYSHSRAGGIWQFLPATGRHYGLEQNWWYDGRRDIIASTEAALDYFAHLHELFDGDWLLALAAYNAGEGRVQRAVRANEARGRPTDFWHLDLPQQTEDYVPRILALRAILAAPGAHGIKLPDPGPPVDLTVVELPGQVDLAMAAEMAGLSVERLYRYNPGFNRWATPPEGPHRLVVPGDSADRLRTALAEQDPNELVRWKRHQVQPGETLSEIATQYRTSVSALKDLNDINGSFIRAGEHLLVTSAARPESAYSLSAENRRRARQASGPDGRQRIAYRVESGDTLWRIAQLHDVSMRRLAAWNDMAIKDPLQPGQRMVVWTDSGRGGPSGRVQRVSYSVRSGDSLYEIARQFNVNVADIRRWNDLERGAYLQPGQQLKLRVDVTEQADAS
jgi:membrane-bound lytic murein transglycosylase D